MKLRTPEEQARRAAQIKRNVIIGEGTDSPPIPAATRMDITEMMARLVFIVSGSMVALLPPEDQEPDGRAIPFFKLAEMREALKSNHALVDGRPVYMFDQWMHHRQRKTVDAISYAIGMGRMVVDRDGRACLNLWTPRTRRKPKRYDELIGYFTRHVEFLVKDDEQRKVVLQWLAHAEQQPHVLPHMAVVMVTQAFGVGRNALASILTRVWRGNVAASLDLQRLLSNNFNEVLVRKLLGVVDELYVNSGGDANARYAKDSKLRELITASEREVNAKWVSTYYITNVMRWLMFSNHLDAMSIPDGDRRFFIVENPAAKHPEEGYYKKLYGLIDRDPDFIESVAWFLATYDIEGFDPGMEAPMTDAKKRMREASMSATQLAVEALTADGEDAVEAMSLHAVAAIVGVKTDEQKAMSHLKMSLAESGWGTGTYTVGIKNDKRTVRYVTRPGVKLTADQARDYILARESAANDDARKKNGAF